MIPEHLPFRFQSARAFLRAGHRNGIGSRPAFDECPQCLPMLCHQNPGSHRSIERLSRCTEKVNPCVLHIDQVRWHFWRHPLKWDFRAWASAASRSGSRIPHTLEAWVQTINFVFFRIALRNASTAPSLSPGKTCAASQDTPFFQRV